MIAIVTLLVAFPAGYFLASRLAANTTYAVAYLWAFVFQTLYLLLDALSVTSKDPAFATDEFPLSYGPATLAVLGVGFGLVAAGQWARSRRPVPVTS
ncbi:hypothetical protein [Nocardioides sp. B-3]|uniref:hypothetical protein n=1 Tax=Nocardioides sp. B-3 TaxID=2895565 RepID=UPI0021537CF3|nr:hypothetical protein [Nocardioides sp. B-3]UUZ61193.1 hypothetical protein LP418_11585 [Nocardioides sp. B-3]